MVSFSHHRSKENLDFKTYINSTILVFKTFQNIFAEYFVFNSVDFSGKSPYWTWNPIFWWSICHVFWALIKSAFFPIRTYLNSIFLDIIDSLILFLTNIFSFLKRSSKDTLFCCFNLRQMHSRKLISIRNYRVRLPYARDKTALLNRPPSWIERLLKNELVK